MAGVTGLSEPGYNGGGAGREVGRRGRQLWGSRKTISLGGLRRRFVFPEHSAGCFYSWMKELSIITERHTQLIDITDRVLVALGSGVVGSAVLVSVPHTTAGITINERIDPALVTDLERGFEKIVGDHWGWKHDDKDGPNGPSHARAMVAGCQVLLPLREGKPVLGRYQGIFLCEFDGPKTRTVYVTVLQ